MKSKKISLLFLSLICPIFGYAETRTQISIVPTSTAAISVNSTSATPVTYNVTANAPIRSIQVSASSPDYPLPSYITATLSADTCTNQTLTSAGTCSFVLSLISDAGHTGSTFTLAPVVSGNSGASRSIPIASNRISATVSAVPSTSTTISANAANVLFSFNDANATGAMGTGYSTITITNTGAAAALSVEPGALPSGVTLSSSSGCGSIAANGTCTMTFTTNTTPDSAQSISIAGTNTNTLVRPIAPLSIRIYSPPVNPVPTNASLMLVNTCTTPELLAITNNSASAVTDLTFDTSAFTSVTTDVSNCPVSSLPAGKTCVVGISANTTAVNTNGASILMGWNSLSAQGAILTGVEATGATLPTISTPVSPVTAFGGLVYQEDTTCNLVKVAALADQYSGTSNTTPWTLSAYQNTDVPNPATGTGTGAQNTGLAAGQINTTAIIYQAGTPLSDYVAGLCSQYSEASGGVNYVGWYLPWDNNDSAGTTTAELAAMYTALKLGQASGTNGFANDYYWSSSEVYNDAAGDRDFDNGNPDYVGKSYQLDYVRCSRALTY